MHSFKKKTLKFLEENAEIINIKNIFKGSAENEKNNYDKI